MARLPAKAKEVVLVPHLYDIRWSRNLNRLLSTVFSTPYTHAEQGYMKSRSITHHLIGYLLPWLRSHGDAVKGLFFQNLTQDFDADYVIAGWQENVWGIVHGSLFTAIEPGVSEKKFQPVERAIGEYARGVYVASDLMKRQLPYPTENTGLPLFGNPREPETLPGVLWNHRLSEEKGYKKILDLPQGVRDRIVMTCPKFLPHKVPEMKRAVGQFHAALPDAAYEKVAAGCGYALSTSDYDNFGYGVLESVWAGKFALVPSGDHLAYAEYLPPAMLYDDPGEIPEKLAYLDEKPLMRADIVRKAQRDLGGLRSDRWLAALLGRVGVEA